MVDDERTRFGTPALELLPREGGYRVRSELGRDDLGFVSGEIDLHGVDRVRKKRNREGVKVMFEDTDRECTLKEDEGQKRLTCHGNVRG